MLLWKRQEDVHLIKIRHDIYHMNHVHSVDIIAIPPAGVRRFLGIYQCMELSSILTEFYTAKASSYMYA